jgi:23S rRNA pseudouridine1911/1915/1917 synthase
MELKILYEDKHLIVAVKPPMVPLQSDHTNDEDMLKIVTNHLASMGPGAPKPYLGLVHRLDRPVGGLMVFAKTEFANARLSEAIRLKQFKKTYLAVVCGKPENPQGELKDYLVKLSTVNMSKIAEPGRKNAKEAILDYALVETIQTEAHGELSLLKIQLKTGRHHQIRVQLAHAGIPIWGDTKYNPQFVKTKGWVQAALWAAELSFKHPKENKTLEFKEYPQAYPFSLFLPAFEQRCDG